MVNWFKVFMELKKMLETIDIYVLAFIEFI